MHRKRGEALLQLKVASARRAGPPRGSRPPPGAAPFLRALTWGGGGGSHHCSPSALCTGSSAPEGKQGNVARLGEQSRCPTVPAPLQATLLDDQSRGRFGDSIRFRLPSFGGELQGEKKKSAQCPLPPPRPWRLSDSISARAGLQRAPVGNANPLRID